MKHRPRFLLALMFLLAIPLLACNPNVLNAWGDLLASAQFIWDSIWTTPEAGLRCHRHPVHREPAGDLRRAARGLRGRDSHDHPGDRRRLGCRPALQHDLHLGHALRQAGRLGPHHGAPAVRQSRRRLRRAGRRTGDRPLPGVRGGGRWRHAGAPAGRRLPGGRLGTAHDDAPARVCGVPQRHHAHTDPDTHTLAHRHADATPIPIGDAYEDDDPPNHSSIAVNESQGRTLDPYGDEEVVHLWVWTGLHVEVRTHSLGGLASTALEIPTCSGTFSDTDGGESTVSWISSCDEVVVMRIWSQRTATMDLGRPTRCRSTSCPERRVVDVSVPCLQDCDFFLERCPPAAVALLACSAEVRLGGPSGRPTRTTIATCG